MKCKNKNEIKKKFRVQEPRGVYRRRVKRVIFRTI